MSDMFLDRLDDVIDIEERIDFVIGEIQPFTDLMTTFLSRYREHDVLESIYEELTELSTSPKIGR